MHTRPGYHRRVCDRFSFQNISLERSGHNPREVSLCTETVHHRLCRHSPRNRLHSPLAEIKAVCSSIILLESSSTTLGKTSLEPCPMKKKPDDRQTFLPPSSPLTFHGLSFQPRNHPLKEFKFIIREERFWRRKVSDFKREHRKLSDQATRAWLGGFCAAF